jgi:cell division protein FtsI/penicillin-binding protein 2/cell division protein FtsW (lipid II flippase)
MENTAQPIFYISWALWLLYCIFFSHRPRQKETGRQPWHTFPGMLLATAAIFSLFFLLVRDFKSDAAFFIENYRHTVQDSRQPVVIGSSKEHTCITLENPSAAARHLEIILDETDFQVRNISEGKKVDVNGRYLDRTELRKGDEIVIDGKKRIKILKIHAQYPLGRRFSALVSRANPNAGPPGMTEIHTLLDKAAPLDETGTALLSYQPYDRFLGVPIYYVTLFVMILLLSIGVYLYLKNRFNGALLLLMTASLPFAAGFVPLAAQGIITALFLPCFFYVERKRRTHWRWGSALVLFAYASMFLLPLLARMDGTFILGRGDTAKNVSTSLQVKRGENTFDLFDERRKLAYYKNHRVILGHTLYYLRVDKTGSIASINLSPRDPEKIKVSKDYDAIISSDSDVKPGKNYIYVKYPHEFKPIPASTASAGKKFTAADKWGNSITLSKAVNENYRIYLFGLIFLIVLPFWLFWWFFFYASGGPPFYKKGGPKIFAKGGSHADGFLIYNFVYFMLALGYVMFGALALYNNSYLKNFSKFRHGALPLFVGLFLGALLLSRYNRFPVFLYRLIRQKMYHVPLIVASVLMLAGSYSMIFLILGGVYFIYVFGFRLRRGIVHEYKNAHNYPLDIQKIIETPVCNFESKENKRLFFGLGGVLNKMGWNCLLISDLLLLLALFFIVLQVFLGGEVGVSLGGFFFLPIELGKILLTLYFADWVSRIDKGMKFNVLWVYGLALIPFILLIVFLKDFSPLIVFTFVFFYHIIKTRKTIRFRLLVILSVLALLWITARDLGRFTFPSRLFALLFTLFILFILLRMRRKSGASGKPAVHILKRIALASILLVLLVGVNYIVYTRDLPVPRVLGERVSVWLNPWQDYDNSFQYVNALWLMKDAGTFGKTADALTAASQVPLIEKDLSFALYAGALGTAGVILLFLTLFLTAIAVLRRTGSRWRRYVMEFLTVIFAAQFLVPAMYTTGLLPLMGQPLPFLSYSNNTLLLFALPFAFLMINITRTPQENQQVKQKFLEVQEPFFKKVPGRRGHYATFLVITGIIAAFILLRLCPVTHPRDIEEKNDIVFLEPFQERGGMFKIKLTGGRFTLTPLIRDLEIDSQPIHEETQLHHEDIISIGSQRYRFKEYPSPREYKEIYARPLQIAFPTASTVKYTGGWFSHHRKQILADPANAELMQQLIIEIAPGQLKKLAAVLNRKNSPGERWLLMELRGDETAVQVRSLTPGMVRLRGLVEKPIKKNKFFPIASGDILAIPPELYIKFAYRAIAGERNLVISYKQQYDGPIERKPQSAILRALDTGMTYGINLDRETLFAGEAGLFSFTLNPLELWNKLYLPDKIPRGKIESTGDYSQRKQVRRPTPRTTAPPRKPAIVDTRRNILAFTSEINGRHRRFYSTEVPPDLLYLLGAKSQETWGLEQIFSRLYRTGRIDSIRLTLDLEWQKIAQAAMRDILIENRDKELNNPVYRKLLKEREAVELQLTRHRESAAAEQEKNHEAILNLENRLKEIDAQIDLEKNRLYEAAVVLMSPGGQIRTAASYPFDEETLKELNPEISAPYLRDVNPHLNRAWKWKYNPGSTAKILDSMAFLHARDRFPYLNWLLGGGSAFNYFPRTDLKWSQMLNGKELNFHLRNFQGHDVPPGYCSLTEALTHSYNTYFAYLALHASKVLTIDSQAYPNRWIFTRKSSIPVRRMYREYPILEMAERLMMNRKIDLLANFRDTGLHTALRRMPNDAFTAIRSVYPVNAYTVADVAHYAIGQGDFQITALQNAMVASVILNGGELYFPSLIQSVTLQEADNRPGRILAPDPGKSKIRLISPDAAREIKKGMREVVVRGTAWGVFGELVRDHEFYAKTGTAETGIYKDNALFVGFVKFKNDTHLIFSVIVPRSGLGARIAGKLTARIIKDIIDASGGPHAGAPIKGVR